MDGSLKTPWGDTEELRSLHLPRGRGRSSGPDEWRRQKRRKLFGGLVEALAGKPYAELTISDLAEVSGVDRNDFYRAFPGGKRDFLLDAVERLYRHAEEVAVDAYGREEDWEAGVRAGWEAIVKAICSQPDAARMGIVEVYAAGPAGAELVDDALVRFERLLSRSLALSERRAGMPAEIVAAVVSGMQMVLHDRLRRGGRGAVRKVSGELIDWALSYETPPLPLKEGAAARWRRHCPPCEGADERIVRAVAEISADPALSLTAERIAGKARISLSTLYKHCERGTEDAFLMAFDTICRRAFAVCFDAYQGDEGWPLKMHAVNHPLFSYLASEPGFAKTVLVDVLGAGAEALKHRHEALEPFRQLLGEGYTLNPRAPEVADEAIVYAVYSLAGRRVAREGAGALPSLAPTATYLELAPFVGAGRAAQIADSAPRRAAARRDGAAVPTPAAGWVSD